MRENNRTRGVVRAIGATIFATLMFGAVATTASSGAQAATITAGSRVSPRWTGAIDTTSASAVNAAYWSRYAPKQTLSIDWLLGSILGCVPGLTSSSTNAATLSSLNFVRSLAGLAPVTFSNALNASAQKAALIMAANGSLSHSPSSNWKCWSPDGAQAASRSNLALAYPKLQAGRIVDLYMSDPGAENTAVGHRRWLLNPFSTVMGSGSTPTANAITVIGPTNAYRPNPRWVGWPTAGYFPNAIEPNGRWSLSAGLKSISFGSARVAVYRGTTRIPVQRFAVHSGYGQPTLVWQMPAGFSRSGNYRVVVTRIKQAGVSTYLKKAYTVRLFTPSQ